MAAAIVPICLDGVIHTNIQVWDSGQGCARWLTTGDAEDVPFEVHNAGTGCVLCRREVFEAICWPWYKFEEVDRSGQVISEDIYFGNLARQHRYTYKVHPQALCGHLKKINLLDIVAGLEKGTSHG